MKHLILILLLMIALLMISMTGLLPITETQAAEPSPTEIVSARTQTSKAYYLGENKYSIDASIGAVHYKDAAGTWQNIDNTITSGVMDKASYTFRLLQNTFNQGQVVEFSANSSYVRLQPMELQYSNDLGQIQAISMPQAVVGTVTNTPIQLLPGVDSQQGKITWLNAYGAGRTFEWITEPTRLTKILTIPSFANLPIPPAYIINGGNPYLRLNMIFAPSSDMEIYVDGILWNKSSTVQTFGRIEFRKNGNTLWDFAPLLSWDSEGNSGESIKTLRKAGNNLYIEIRVPYSWLQNATYPIYIDTTIDVDVATSADDGFSDDTGHFRVIDTDIKIGNNSGNITQCFYRFTGITIPQGSTVGANTTISLVEYVSTATAQTKIFADDQNNPVAPTTAADHNGRTRTTNGVEWDGDLGSVGVRYASPSIQAVIQELSTSYDYSNEAIMILHDNDSSPSGGYQRVYETQKAGDYEPHIHIEYSAGGGVSAPTVVTGNTTAIEETTMTFQGNITNTGGENATSRGFYYTANTSEVGSFGTGNFTYDASSLSPGTTYLITAYAINSGGIGYGGNVTAVTKPNAPTSLAASNQTSTEIELTWTKGTGSENTTIRYRTDGTYPTSYTDGTLGYSGTASTANLSGLSGGTQLKIKAWAVNTVDEIKYSDDGDELTDYTLPGDPSGLTLTSPGCTTLTANWTNGDGADKSMVRWKEGAYPANEIDGTQAYFDTANTTVITGLPSGTLIYVGIFGYDSSSGYYSSGSAQDSENTTASANPTVVTQNATTISYTTATLNATISGLTCANVTGILLEWGTSSGSYTENWTDTVNYGNVSFDHNDTFSSNTTYFYRAGAKLAGGAYQYGGEVAFATLTIEIPTVVSSNATSITSTTATLNGNITVSGGENADIRGFDLGLSSGNYTDNLTNSGSFGVGAFTYPATGLSANTTYYFRAKAHNSAGWSYGSELNFTTSVTPPPVEPPPTGSGGTPAIPIAQTMTISQISMLSFFIFVAFWRCDIFLYLISSIVLITSGLMWRGYYIDTLGMVVSLILIGLGLYALVLGILNVVRNYGHT